MLGAILISLVWVLVPTIIYLLILWWIDRYEKEPLPLVFVTLLGGILIAPALTFLAEKFFGLPLSIYPHYFTLIKRFSFISPIIEELSKGLVILGIFFIIKEEFDDMLDGILYGAVVGAGFAAVENFSYFFQLYTKFSSWIVTPGKQFLPVLAGGWNHCFYGALFGAALGATRMIKNRGLKVLIPVWGLILGIGFHIAHDYLPVYFSSFFGRVSPEMLKVSGVALQLFNLAGIFILFGIVLWAWEHGLEVITRQLKDEVEKGIVTQEEYDYLTMPVYSQVAAGLTGFIKNPCRWRTARKIHRCETELAYRKWHALRKGLSADRAAGADSLRDKIKKLRG